MLTPIRASAEPTREDCEAAVEQARALAAALPADDLSRYFAERDLQQAMIEAGNGEFDDCLEMAAARDGRSAGSGATSCNPARR